MNIHHGRRRIVQTLGLIMLCWDPAGGRAAAEPAELSASARRILDAWQADQPEPGRRLLRIIGWHTVDRQPPADRQPRLDRILTHIQGFYRREMERHGFGPRTFQLERDPAGRLVVHDVTGQGNHTDYGKADGGRIRQECVPVLRRQGIEMDAETVMIFTNLAAWDPERRTFEHWSPYYAGGDWRRGTAWQLDSPELDPCHLPLRTPEIQDGEYGRISLGKHNSIFIGGIAHELGHALGLPHCRARPDEESFGTALMGSGNQTYADEERGDGRGTFLTLAHAFRLAAHPQFSGSVKGITINPEGRFDQIGVAINADGRSFTLSGRVQGSPPVYGVVAYLDPSGNGDYDARTSVAVPDAEGCFAVDGVATPAGRPAQVRLVACHANGGMTQIAYPFLVTDAGQVDLTVIRVFGSLERFFAALEQRDEEAARAVIPMAEPARSLAAAVLAGRLGKQPRLSIANVPRDQRTLALSHLAPTEASVGWGRPTYDALPRREAILEAAGSLHPTGIYAHAPARHCYQIAGRSTRLTGLAGLPTQAAGSVVFVIRVDGQERYRSAIVRPGMAVSYDVDTVGGQALELITEDAGDGMANDWGLWLSPVLGLAP